MSRRTEKRQKVALFDLNWGQASLITQIFATLYEWLKNAVSVNLGVAIHFTEQGNL